MRFQRFGTILVTGATLVMLSSSAYAASSASSSAFGESVKVNVLPLLGSPVQVTSGPLPSVSGSAPPPYSSSNQVASAKISLGLLISGGLETGLLTVHAASNVPNANSASADATVDQTKAAVAALVGLTADVIKSNVNSSGTCGAMSSNGATVLANARLNGVALTASPAPNTVVLNVGGIRVVLNEQVATGNGTTDTGLTVNAIHIALDDAPFGLGVISGDIIISQSKASLHCAAASADLGVVKTARPNPAQIGSPLTYTAEVSNAGPDTATGVVLTDVLPSSATFISATSSQGSCSGTTTITCNLGSVAAGTPVTVTIEVTATGPHLTNTATVKGNESDPNPANNSSTVIVGTH